MKATQHRNCKWCKGARTYRKLARTRVLPGGSDIVRVATGDIVRAVLKGDGHAQEMMIQWFGARRAAEIIRAGSKPRPYHPGKKREEALDNAALLFRLGMVNDVVPEDFTKSGAPTVEGMARIAGVEKVTAAERNTVWDRAQRRAA